MKRLTYGTVPLLALLLVAGCSSDPTGDLRNGLDALLASPSQLFLEPGETKQVEIGGVDGQGNPIDETYTVTAVGAGISVKRDSSFLPVYVNDTLLTAPASATRFRFIVTADTFGTSSNSFPATSFTVGAGGKTVTVPVQVTPLRNLQATFNTLTPGLGDTVIMTAPPGITFVDTAKVTFDGAPFQPVIVGRTPDGTQISFLTPPNAGGPVRVNGVISPSSPGVLLKPLTTQSLSTFKIDTVDAVFSTTTPAIGASVTLTLPAKIKFGGTLRLLGPANSVDTVSFTNVSFPGQVAGAANITPAPDSGSLTFSAQPNASGVARLDSLVFPGGYRLSLPTRTSLTSGSLGSTVAVTFSNNNPAIGEVVTATAPVGFRFGPDSLDATVAFNSQQPLITHILNFGGKIAGTQGISADSTQVTFVPLPGTSAPATIPGLRLVAQPQFLITLPTADTVRVPNLTPLANADDPVTAPSLTLPAPGGTTTLFDAGPYKGPIACCGPAAIGRIAPPAFLPGGLTRLYKVVLPVPATLTFTVEWFQALFNIHGLDPSNLFLFFAVTPDPTDPAATINFSDFDESTPETGTFDLPAGTFFLALVSDAGVPDLIKITLDRAP